jgi:hypothetical protein
VRGNVGKEMSEQDGCLVSGPTEGEREGRERSSVNELTKREEGNEYTALVNQKGGWKLDDGLGSTGTC